MNFDYNEEQQLLADSVRRFLAKDYGFEARRKIIASKDGWSPAVWAQLTEMGLMGLPFSPDYGGFGGGAVDLMGVMEAAGDAMLVEPYLATVGLGAQLVARAGGKAKCDYVVKELGFDACVDYKAGNLQADLKAACPKGIDVNFENVGGEIFDTILPLTNTFARVIVCGLISGYNATTPYEMKNIRAVLVNRIRMQGMIVFDWHQRYAEARSELAGMVQQGKIKTRESVANGIESAPKAFIGLLKGENFGKQLVKLA